ncbi:MAG: hypothetical protein KIT35_01430 [Piscinibacter sp.]|uniref:tetratricopeptide repeat protein n=1 Tax=Piscinibacter sp. TaxID=1903157 RepID=UPI0025899D0E|nr:tetratricopeptide repeat protein [Piscinibacter sp.]MCW5662469.1 hypothetical protein [Piscinibacter sp.]
MATTVITTRWRAVRIGAALRHAAVLWAGLAGLLPAASAQQVPGYPASVTAYDRREVAMLPKYCAHTQLFRDHVPGGNDGEQIRAYTALFGPVFNDLHHYCYGLMKVNRAILLSRDPTTRRFYLNDAVGEYDYVIQRAKPDFLLLPEILTKKGEALVHLGRGAIAVFEFERAIELKSDYWPPYARLADYHKDNGDLQKAREVLEAGLQAVPDTKALQRRLSELDAASAGRKW